MRGAATAAQHAVDAVAVEQRRRASRAFADALRQHLDDVVEVVAREVAERPGAADEVVEVVLGPVLAGALGDDLLREDVERRDRLHDAVETARAHGADERGALDQLVAAGREETALRLAARARDRSGRRAAGRSRRCAASRSGRRGRCCRCRCRAPATRCRPAPAARPALRRCSTRRRRSFERLPWWLATAPRRGARAGCGRRARTGAAC